jgi:DNA polymerase III subunit gamma/tau
VCKFFFQRKILLKLSQKYRPGRFKDVIGQTAPVEILRASVAKNKFSSSYMFSGPSGIGKTTVGRILSKAILCDSPQDGDPCCKCESCLLFDKEQHFGYVELDAASVGGKDDMVKLRDEASYLGVSKKKIILLDECHDISKQGQDALLEQVEKCPEHLMYIFCTTDPNMMKKTLKDRCMQFQFFKISPDLISQRLKYICEQEKISYEDEALNLIASRSDGHIRVAINLIEEIVYLGAITIKNLEVVSKDYDEEIFTVLANLGLDLSKVIEAAHSISSSISATEFYNHMLSMVTDAAKSLYGYDDFSQKRKDLISRLKDIHGHSLLELLNYFISRDKFVDKVGLQSDLIVLHYKFTSNNFIPKPQTVTPIFNTQNQSNQSSTQGLPKKEAQLPFYPQLQKLGISEKSKLLREKRRGQKPEQKEEPEKIPDTWPLPKEERLGESFDEKELSPEEFSKQLVGGRGSGNI